MTRKRAGYAPKPAKFSRTTIAFANFSDDRGVSSIHVCHFPFPRYFWRLTRKGPLSQASQDGVPCSDGWRGRVCRRSHPAHWGYKQVHSHHRLESKRLNSIGNNKDSNDQDGTNLTRLAPSLSVLEISQPLNPKSGLRSLTKQPVVASSNGSTFPSPRKLPVNSWSGGS